MEYHTKASDIQNTYVVTGCLKGNALIDAFNYIIKQFIVNCLS